MTNDARVAGAWSRVVYDCGCPDLYFCPQADEVECPRHDGFSTCCDRLDLHQPIPAGLRTKDPRPRVNPDDE